MRPPSCNCDEKGPFLVSHGNVRVVLCRSCACARTRTLSRPRFVCACVCVCAAALGLAARRRTLPSRARRCDSLEGLPPPMSCQISPRARAPPSRARLRRLAGGGCPLRCHGSLAARSFRHVRARPARARARALRACNATVHMRPPRALSASPPAHSRHSSLIGHVLFCLKCLVECLSALALSLVALWSSPLLCR